MYDIAVTTEIYHDDDDNDSMFFDGGTMRWFNVSEDVMLWLAGSCGLMFRQLSQQPKVKTGEQYSIQYRTVVSENGKIISDTNTLSFDGMSIDEVVWFWRCAAGQLTEMIPVLEQQYTQKATTVKRSRLRFILAMLRQLLFPNNNPRIDTR